MPDPARGTEEAEARPRLRVVTTQEALLPERLPGTTVVVFDVLLATTTLVTIVENGARSVYAAGSLQEVDHICRGLDPAVLIRGGEQDAMLVEGYDCGPYPAEYPPERVAGRDVVFLSTNGTRALARAASAERLLVGSLRNAPALEAHLESDRPERLVVVCAGSRGGFALEDFVGAAVLLAYLDPDAWRHNDAAWLARDLLRAHGGDVRGLLRRARAGRWFLDHGREELLDWIGEVGASDAVVEVRGGRLEVCGRAFADVP